jgi:Ca2+-binding EF-hand superfamily protein
LIRQYDVNKNGMLERDEWKNMRSEHQAADGNKDQVITVEELAASLQAYSAGGRSGGSGYGSRGGDRGYGDRGYGSRETGGDLRQPAAKKSYRVSSPTERLPKGVPDYFYRNDTDADGQISMSEYATGWSDQIAAEFQKLDKNGDGILTADECVRDDGR